MKFYSTRNKNNTASGAEAICRGISEEGGLYVPSSFPQVGKEELLSFCGAEYGSTAARIIGKFLPELPKLGDYTAKAYSKFDGDPAPIVKLADSTFIMELWHGPTHAFKDIALTLLPYLLADFLPPKHS